jgi:hypothetical protein
VLARQGGGAAGPGDPGRRGFAFWRRRLRAEADGREARAAAGEAKARLGEALAAKAAAEQEAVTAQEQVAAARLERDQAVRGAESRAARVEARAGVAAESARTATNSIASAIVLAVISASTLDERGDAQHPGEARIGPGPRALVRPAAVMSHPPTMPRTSTAAAVPRALEISHAVVAQGWAEPPDWLVRGVRR